MILFLAMLILAGLWIHDPAGNYDPWTVIFGAGVFLIEIIRRRRSSGQSDSMLQTSTKHMRKSNSEEIIDLIHKYGTEKPLSHILPSALQLAQLIGNREIEHWVRMELYGYNEEGGMTKQDTVPEYRAITGKHTDQYNQMLQNDDPELDYLNSYRLRYGVPILEKLAKKTDMQNIRDEDMIRTLRKYLHIEVYRFCFSPMEVSIVLNNIRKQLMEKVNSLEKDIDYIEGSKQKSSDFQLINGFYWTRNLVSKESVAYCPACVANDKNVPLQRETHWANRKPRQDGLYGYRCPNCNFYRELSIQDEDKIGQKLNNTNVD